MEILDRPPTTHALCAHAPTDPAPPRSDRCEECGSPVSLRACSHCGHVGCCESQGAHARGHALAEGHPVIEQMPAGRGFAWCYAERRYVR